MPKNDASLFAFGSHSKKRPQNLVLGRLFDHHLLDMVELGLDNFSSMADFARSLPASAAGGITPESKPCILFQGAEWEHNPTLQSLKGLLTDFFHLRVVDAIHPLGIEHFLCFTAVGEDKIFVRHYLARLLKSAEGTAPHTALTEIGPSMDLTLRRSRLADEETLKQAMVRPKATAAAPKKVKNVTRSKLLGKQGRLHVPRQDLSQMATARMKALRPDKASAEAKRKLASSGGQGDGGGGKRARSE